MDGPDPTFFGMCLELVQDPAANSKAARSIGNPHALELCGLFSVKLERPAAYGFLVERGYEEQTGGRPHILLVGWNALGGIETLFESAVELAEIGAHAELGVGVARIDWADLDHRGREKPLYLEHRRNQALSLACAQRLEERFGDVVGSSIQHSSLRRSPSSQSRDSNPLVGLSGADRDQARLFERSQQPAQITRVEPELSAQGAHVPPLGADLPQQP